MSPLHKLTGLLSRDDEQERPRGPFIQDIKEAQRAREAAEPVDRAAEIAKIESARRGDDGRVADLIMRRSAAAAALQAAQAAYDAADRELGVNSYQTERVIAAAEARLRRSCDPRIAAFTKRLRDTWDIARQANIVTFGQRYDETIHPDGTRVLKPAKIFSTEQCCTSLREAIKQTEAMQYLDLNAAEVGDRLAEIERGLRFTADAKRAWIEN
jgi:hypothetical protein